jgi:xanthine/uracil/vitamin C permease (AzgA family)
MVVNQGRTMARTEVLAGLTTFLTMAYIIFVQPMVLSGAIFDKSTGMDFQIRGNSALSCSRIMLLRFET